MVDSVRAAEAAIDKPVLGRDGSEQACTVFRPSLFAVEDIRQGELLTERNIRSIRTGGGLPPKHLPEVLGKPAAKSIPRGSPFDRQHVSLSGATR